MRERRRHERQPVRLLVQHQANDGAGFDVDYATDLSRGGLFITSARPPARDATLQVQFSPRKDSLLVSAYCRVARVTPEGFGACFVRLDADSEALLASVLERPA